jgi:hypothetical protein
MATHDTNGEGEITTSYVQGAGGLVEQRSGETRYPLADAHGDITAIVGDAGGSAATAWRSLPPPGRNALP